MNKLSVLSSCLLLSACATATPSLIGDHYYMMGDAACVQGQFVSETRMMCLDKNGNGTGYRDGLTAEGLQTQQALASARSQALNQALQIVNQSLQQTNQQIQQQSQQYTAPSVYQPQLSKPADHYYCTTNGGVTTCTEL